MSHSVDEILSGMIELLRECGLDSKADWFLHRRDVLRDSLTESAQFSDAVRELDAATAGMGGFTDIPLTPRSDRLTSRRAGALLSRKWQNILLVRCCYR